MKKQFLLATLALATTVSLSARQANTSKQMIVNEKLNPAVEAILKREFKNGLSAMSTALDKDGFNEAAQQLRIGKEVLKDFVLKAKNRSGSPEEAKLNMLGAVLLTLLIKDIAIVLEEDTKGTVSQYPLTELENFLK